MFGNTPAPTHIGPYVVLRELGRGGMGVVFVARDPVTGRDVAVKQILAEGASGQAIERFVREAEALARVKHKGVVAVHQLGRTKDGPYIVEELIEGEPLSALVKRGALEPMLAARLVREVSDAIAAVHALGIIHRDLKPANVMLREDGSPVLLDFGLARDVNAERLTKTGDVLGTVAYMAPEQADGRTKDLDERVDVYALGAVLFELLAGAPPHSGSSYQMVVNILTKEAPRLRDRNPLAPAALDAVCAVAMASQREQRYQSVRALKDDLDRFLRGETTQAAKRVAASAPRGGRVVVAASVLVVALGIAIGVFVAKRGDDGAPVVEGRPRRPSTEATGPTNPLLPSLWSPPGTGWTTYQLSLDETINGQKLALRATLKMLAGPPKDGAITFSCSVESLYCEQEGYVYDSLTPHSDVHPLSPLYQAVNREFRCTIVATTGEVVAFDGFDEIRDKIKAAHNGDTFASLDAIVNRVFTDGYIGTSMKALTWVREGQTLAPWQPAVSEAGTRFTAAADGQKPILGSLGNTVASPTDAFRIEGEAIYLGRTLSAANLKQVREARAGQAPWSMHWQMNRISGS